ncbi:ubiquinol-cytochrome C chaperone family protein [Henriciella sp. AS95]|uniref:ubiquinol-cytochrome C chaperone family protein n=1 Tax=Henriciella sp. AS95 TaxID=3135782 RepID=UPI0031753442
MSDTLDDRFIAIALHASVLLPELEARGKRGKALSKAVYRRVFDGLDAGLRETGVGDASIARKVRKFGERFFGLGRAIQEAIGMDDPETAVESVLIRNQIGTEASRRTLARYIIAVAQDLSARSHDELLSGHSGLADAGKRTD